MSRLNNNGTLMVCPKCQIISSCRRIGTYYRGKSTNNVRRRQRKIDGKTVHYFLRGRKCEKCNHEFVTAEIPVSFLEEAETFVEQRDRNQDFLNRAYDHQDWLREKRKTEKENIKQLKEKWKTEKENIKQLKEKLRAQLDDIQTLIEEVDSL